MKQLILITIIFYSNLILAQTQLTITSCFCKSDNKISEFDHLTELYKDGVFITDKFYPINDFTVTGLKKGKYLLKYKSIFEQDYEIEIILKKKKKKIEICIDEFRPKNQTTLIEKLERGDTLEIWSYSTGCEYDDYGRIKLTKIENTMKATFIKAKTTREKIISEEEIQLLKELEQKIFLIKDIESRGYTGTYSYEIKVNGKKEIDTFYGIDPIEYRATIKKIFTN